MKSRMTAVVLGTMLAAAAMGLPKAVPAPRVAPATAPTLPEGFRNVPSGARMRMYWRVLGPAWTRAEIDRQLALMKSAGLGGATIYFLYPVALDDPDRGIV